MFVGALSNGCDIWEAKTSFYEAMPEAPSVLLTPALLTLISCQSLLSPFCLTNPPGLYNSSHFPMSLGGFRKKTETEAQEQISLWIRGRPQKVRTETFLNKIATPTPGLISPGCPCRDISCSSQVTVVMGAGECKFHGLAAHVCIGVPQEWL